MKCENLQITGSFKLRGAYNYLYQHYDKAKENGIIAWSAGNHAQGVACAAKKLGIRATICIPRFGSVSKITETKHYGADVVLVDSVFDDTINKAKLIMKEKKLLPVAPFDDHLIIAGQATIGLELLDQIPKLDAVVIPIGGGGLIAGIAYVIKQLNPNCKVYGVEALDANSMV